MANVTEVAETTVKAVEEVGEPAVEVIKKVPKKGKTALIVGGTALGVVVVYFGVKKLVVPAVKKNCKCKKEEVKDEEETEVVTEEKEPEKEQKSKKK